MAADERTYEQRHAQDRPVHLNVTRHLLIAHYNEEFLNKTECVQAMLERDLERYSMPEYTQMVSKAGGLTNFARNIIQMHAEWGVDA
jgi:hypothetical protein